jgi:hypothetical protein
MEEGKIIYISKPFLEIYLNTESTELQEKLDFLCNDVLLGEELG